MKVCPIIMKKNTVFILSLLFFITYQSSKAQVDVVYTDLVWSDEFDNNGAVNDFQSNIYRFHKNAIEYLLSK
mgnify:CR=1 FL=1